MYDQILRDISIEYERKRDRAVYEQKLRINEVYNELPQVKDIDRAILETGLFLSKAIIDNPKNYETSVRKAKKELEKLKMEKAYLLTENNIPADYLEIKYQCDKCKDTGYIPSGDQCNCLKQSLINKAYSMSNIERILKRENFQTHNIDIFPDQPMEGETMTPRENMANITSISEGFTSNFEENNEENLLFYGSTGLGKTFMCNCIAKALLDKNKIVIYQTAFKILEIIERRRFSRDSNRFNDWDYELLFSADLLIIDDLGTELSNAFTNAEIFNIVNTRLLNNTKTIISTNLTPKEISETYTDRVFSRVLERFIPLRFFGPDLRYYRWEAK